MRLVLQAQLALKKITSKVCPYMKKEDHFDVNFSVVEEHVVHGIDDQHMLIQISMPSILEALTHLVTKVRLTAFKTVF
ncbi:hypothetical protein QL285_025539 [Trifolium repens]|nr:hypothetical protein QL285_025539 [Trifolium repens]